MRTSRILIERLHRTALVSLKSHEAFKGVLWQIDQHVVVLRNVEQVQTSGDTKTIAVDGEIVLLIADVAYMQLL